MGWGFYLGPLFFKYFPFIFISTCNNEKGRLHLSRFFIGYWILHGAEFLFWPFIFSTTFGVLSTAFFFRNLPNFYTRLFTKSAVIAAAKKWGRSAIAFHGWAWYFCIRSWLIAHQLPISEKTRTDIQIQKKPNRPKNNI